MTFEEWYRTGVDSGYCGPVTCLTHDTIATDQELEDLFELGDDPCLFGVRLTPPLSPPNQPKKEP